jgi:predicted O-linked N-acetylglucosamine transferase (SPINDLY family)
VRRRQRVAVPFSFLAVSDSAVDQLCCAQVHAAHKFPAPPAPWSGRRYGHERIRLAYLSADFHDHATARLTAGLFEHHDRSRFEVIGVSYGRQRRDAMRARLEKAFDRFVDVSSKADREVASLLREAEVDLAIDLKGYTQDARPGILAARAAPSQVSYLGFPGTLGAAFVDYLIVDRHLIREGEAAHYAEKLVYLPDSYQANDSAREIAPTVQERAAAGLPPRGFVFCCFNASYKIVPAMFDVWMRLLRDFDGSVLWLFEDNADAVRNLRREAGRRGVSGDRLVFAPRAAPPEHLARHALADLFLDTLPYGAHTTASDALWAGLPVLTCTGAAFAGRVATSLLQAIGVPELIAADLASYEARARALAGNPAELAALREKLARNRLTHPLFDTARFARNLEAAFVSIWQREQAR